MAMINNTKPLLISNRFQDGKIEKELVFGYFIKKSLHNLLC